MSPGFLRYLIALLLSAYAVSPARPAEITLTRQGELLNLSWPSAVPAWRLQYCTNLADPTWLELTNFTVTSDTYAVAEPPTDTNRLYRLCQKPASEEQPPVPVVVISDGDITLSTAGTTIVEGSIDNIFDASQSSDPRGGTLHYHWVVSTPNSVQYTCQGVTGYHSPQLSVLADAIPSFAQTIKLTLTLTHEPFDPYATSPQSSTTTYTLSYRNSALTIGMSTSCQNCTSLPCTGCNIAAGLATTETP